MPESQSTVRLYGSAIALVSGGYSLLLATTGAEMTGAAWLMLALGLVVLVHGVLLLTPAAARIGAASGPLMLAYAVVMLLNQAWIATADPTGGMNGLNGMGGMGGMGGMDGMTGISAGMGWDAGMVALAVLMLASGVIMTTRRGTMEGGGRSGMG